MLNEQAHTRRHKTDFYCARINFAARTPIRAGSQTFRQTGKKDNTGDFNEVPQNIWLAKNHFKVAKWNSLACHNATAVCVSHLIELVWWACFVGAPIWA